MNEEARAKLNHLSDAISEAVDAIDAALEEKSRDRVLAAHDKLSAATRVYDEVLAACDPTEKAQVEQRFGRRITDLKRQASRMPKGASGRTAAIAKDAGSVPFIEQRAPGRSMQEFAAPSRRDEKPKYTVGGEVEAWCGPCAGLRTHNIFALVEGEPDIVICQSCGGRHGFRTTPARKAAGAQATGARGGSSAPTREQLEEEKRQKERMALRKELAEAQEVRPFSPKERYKAGEIIEHPEHGRGKVENVTRGSILVRFAAGLRPLDLS